MLSLNGARNSNLRRCLVVELTLVSISVLLLPMSRQALVMIQAFFDDVSIVPLKPRGGPVEELVERRRNARVV